MKLKKIKFPRRRSHRKKNAEKEGSSVYKCLLLGPNIYARNSFLDELNGEHSESVGTNEVFLKLDNSDFVIWKVDQRCEKNKFCIKQYLDFHNPDILIYFIDILDFGEEGLELMVQKLEVLMEVIHEDQTFCIAFDKQCLEVLADHHMEADVFKENVMRLINNKIDFQFQTCFSNLEGMKEILLNLSSAEGTIHSVDDGNIDDVPGEDDDCWGGFCDIGGCEDYFLAPLPEKIVGDERKKKDTPKDRVGIEEGGSWLGEAGMNIVENL